MPTSSTSSLNSLVPYSYHGCNLICVELVGDQIHVLYSFIFPPNFINYSYSGYLAVKRLTLSLASFNLVSLLGFLVLS